MLADLRKKNITGKELQTKLDEVHITVNKNAIPNDPQDVYKRQAASIAKLPKVSE